MVALTLTLATRAPFAVAPLLAALAAHAVPGVERTDVAARTHSRLLRVGGADVHTIVRFPAADGGPADAGASRPAGGAGSGPGDHVTVDVDLARTDGRPLDDAQCAEVVRQVRAWFDLDADPGPITAAFGADPVLGPLVARRPGLRVLGHPVGFEAAVGTVLGQQVSVAAGRTFAARLVDAYGPVPDDAPDGLVRFPSAPALAAVDPAELQRTVGLTHARARTLHAVAEACAGGLELHRDGNHAEVRAGLLAVPGIGPWTVEYLALRALGDRDAFPAHDLVLRRALGVGSAAAARRAAEGWSPLRAYAAFHLWTARAYS